LVPTVAALGFQRKGDWLPRRRDPFDVAGGQAHERLPGIEFKIGLIAHKPPKAIDLIRAVRGNPNPRIE